MGNMYNYLLTSTPTKRIYSLLFFAGLIFCVYQTALAQPEDDMDIFLMYYEEKDLVVSSTRHLKHLSQVAENITVITAKQIEDANAHTVAEVLNHVPGLFIFFYHSNFGSPCLAAIQGGDPRHVLFLVDGFPWNSLTHGIAEPLSIPIGIIERIEIIKGPASSVWGSALGGVINIITKPAGDTTIPETSIKASYGEKERQNFRADISGKAGPVGYYLFAGHQEQTTSEVSESFDNLTLFSKFKIVLSDMVQIGLSIGGSEPEIGLNTYKIDDDFIARNFNELTLFNLQPKDISSNSEVRTFFITSTVDFLLTQSLSIHISLNRFVHDYDYFTEVDLGTLNFIMDHDYDETSERISSHIVWETHRHTIVLGIDYDKGELETTSSYFFTEFSATSSSFSSDDNEKWAIYANDTIVINKLTLIPGIRYDYDQISGSFTSPSLGLTYNISQTSILRASISRGFTSPPISYVSGEGILGVGPNPSLEPDEGWSYQLGLESNAAKYLWIKTTLYYQKILNNFMRENTTSAYVTKGEPLINNEEKFETRGVEFELQTIPIYNLSLYAGFNHIDLSPAPNSGLFNNASYTIGMNYNDKKSVSAKLTGHFVLWDTHYPQQDDNDDFLWDFTLNKRITAIKRPEIKFYITAHNIFNGSQLVGNHVIEFHINQFQYSKYEDWKTTGWMEVGTRIVF